MNAAISRRGIEFRDRPGALVLILPRARETNGQTLPLNEEGTVQPRFDLTTTPRVAAGPSFWSGRKDKRFSDVPELWFRTRGMVKVTCISASQLFQPIVPE
jgi:hypothetical protein